MNFDESRADLELGLEAVLERRAAAIRAAREAKLAPKRARAAVTAAAAAALDEMFAELDAQEPERPAGAGDDGEADALMASIAADSAAD